MTDKGVNSLTVSYQELKEGIMKFRIHDGDSEDSLVIEGDTIEELQEIAKKETEKRGWKDCWSEEVA